MLVFILSLTTRSAASCALWLALAGFLHAQTNGLAARAGRVFNEAKVAAHKNPDDHSASVQLARCSYDWAEFARDNDEREEIAQTGIRAARAVIARESTNAAAPYWLGMNLGQLARTRTLGALPLVREMEALFHRARVLDPHTDYAGPDRSLGRLYRDAPGWPTSVGSKKKAREHLERAVQLHPEFPDNQLVLLESFEKWSDKPAFDRQIKITERTLTEARAKFTGAAWEASRADWEKHFASLKARAAGVGKSTPSKGTK